MAPHEEDLFDEEPPTINPYETLGLEKTATADEVKSAYRKAALKNHPDKQPEHLKVKAHGTFQEIAFAYAVLSDPVRRKRYDTTGSTSEAVVDGEGFDWSDFYREQYKDVVSMDAIEKFAAKYKHSDEEKDDLLAAFIKFEGNMSKIYEVIMLSNAADDEKRFREIIDAAIASGDVEPYKAYKKESKASRKRRVAQANDEAEEAMEYAKELGIADKLFGKSSKKSSGEDGLKALIQSRQANMGSFLDNLEAKYGGKKPKSGKKRVLEEDNGEPSEEAFQKAAARLKRNKDVPVEKENGRNKRAKK